MKKVKLTIEGMHCGSCAGNIEKSLKQNTKVKEARVSSLTNKAIIEADDDVTEVELRNAVSKVGYKVVKVE